MVAEWSNASIKHRRLGCGSPEAAEGSLAELRLTCNCIRRGLSGSCLTGPLAGRPAFCLRVTSTSQLRPSWKKSTDQCCSSSMAWPPPPITTCVEEDRPVARAGIQDAACCWTMWSMVAQE